MKICCECATYCQGSLGAHTSSVHKVSRYTVHARCVRSQARAANGSGSCFHGRHEDSKNHKNCCQMRRIEPQIVELLLLGVLVGGWSCKVNSKEYALKTGTESEAVAVQVRLPERQDMSRQVLLPGSIEAFEQVTLYAKAAGYLKWIKVDI